MSLPWNLAATFGFMAIPAAAGWFLIGGVMGGFTGHTIGVLAGAALGLFISQLAD